ncbi:MAG: hypothetical protein JNG89_16560 [Planctomycetaceae bacterium]|nr:hypothetical protein [Planctomycetaceae bacterium]
MKESVAEMHGWTRISSDTRSGDCYVPSGDPAPHALLYLRDRHSDSPSDDAGLTRELQRHRLRVYSPAVDGCWWVDRPCEAFGGDVPSPLHWLQQVAAADIALRWGVAPRQIGLLGTGIGGHGVLQLAYRFPKQFPVVAAIAPAVDFHTHYHHEPVLQEVFSSAEAARQETATLRIHPLNWPPHQWIACDPRDPDWFDGCERLASKLSSIGIPFESDLKSSIEGARRDYERAMLPRALEFLTQRLLLV